MAYDTFNIEDLSVLIKAYGEGRPLTADLFPDDLTIPILVDKPPEDPRDLTIRIVDTLTSEEPVAYQTDQGSYLRYRVAILGIGNEVERIFVQLKMMLEKATDLLVENLNLWSRYQVGLFGGKPKEGGVDPGDADILAARLALFKPNYLLLVNMGGVKNKFADKTPRQLALLTNHINKGAMSGGQRPYSLVIVTDSLIPKRNFELYQRLCQAMNTFHAQAQFAPREKAAIVAHVRLVAQNYVKQHMKVRRET